MGARAGSMPTYHPSWSLRPDSSLQKMCQEQCVVTTRMAVQRMGPGELIPQMAQTLYMPVLVNGEACTMPGVMFLSLQLPIRVVCGIFVGSGWLPGRNTEATACSLAWRHYAD